MFIHSLVRNCINVMKLMIINIISEINNAVYFFAKLMLICKEMLSAKRTKILQFKCSLKFCME